MATAALIALLTTLPCIGSNITLIGSVEKNDSISNSKSYIQEKSEPCPEGTPCFFAVTVTDLANVTKQTYHWDQPMDTRNKRVVTVILPITSTQATSTYSVTRNNMKMKARNDSVSAGRKRKSEDGGGAPFLNYIYDSYSSSHQHRSERPSSPGNIYAVSSERVTALVGSKAHLDCKVNAQQDKVVSWVRRKSSGDMELLTTGTQMYTSDDRYSSVFVAPDIWRLGLRGVRPSDAAEYNCQLSAHPPRVAKLFLDVPEVSVSIVDGAGAVLSEQVCEVGSTVVLRCEVRGLDMTRRALHWYRREHLLNDDTTRGGVSVVVRYGEDGGDGVLRVAKVMAMDGGEYECRVVPQPKANVNVSAKATLHVIKGEQNLAELHQGSNAQKTVHRISLQKFSYIIIGYVICKFYF